jgi:flagellin-specific chaperone FliS
MEATKFRESIDRATKISKEGNVPLMNESMAELDEHINELQYYFNELLQNLNDLRTQKAESLAEKMKEMNTIKTNYGQEITNKQNAVLTIKSTLNGLKQAKRTLVASSRNVAMTP